MPNWPRDNPREMRAFYGEPGRQTRMLVPPEGYNLKLYGTTPMRRLAVHPKVHDAALRVLTRTLEHYGAEEVERLHLNWTWGCLQVRARRGGTSLSTHAFACAFDFDKNRNELRWGRDRAEFAKPIYEKWFEFWYDEGAISLGMERNYDWMHTQFALL